MIVVGIDPGGTTGLAILMDDGTPKELKQISGYDILHQKQLQREFIRWLRAVKPKVVAIEDFVGGGYRDKHSSMTLKLVGLFVALAAAANCNVSVQVPRARHPYLAQAKAMNPNKANNHATDAFAHALAAASIQERKNVKGSKNDKPRARATEGARRNGSRTKKG